MDIKKDASNGAGKLSSCSCANCGCENVSACVTLMDKNVLCKNCLKKTAQLYNPEFGTLDDYQCSLKQIDDGEKLYKRFFADKKNTRLVLNAGLFSAKIETNTSAGLFMVTSKTGSNVFWGGKKVHLVYRIADIFSIDRLKDEILTSKGSYEKDYADINLYKVRGIGRFKIYCDPLKIAKFKRDMNRVMGLTGLKGMKNAFNASRAKAAVEGKEQLISNVSPEDVEEIFYADRKALLERADAAIKEVLS